MGNIVDDINLSDLVIGTMSASAIDSALGGLDYIAYDNSIMPFSDDLNLSIFSTHSPIPVVSNKNELIDHLDNYKPNYGTKIMKLIRPYKFNDNVSLSLDNNLLNQMSVL